MPRQISELFFTLRAKTEGLSNDLNTSQRQLGKWADFVKANPVASAAALGAALIGIGVKAVEMASKMEEATTSIANNLPKGTASATELRDTINSIAQESGVARDQIAQTAQEVAKLGAASGEELKQRLEAVQLFTDATGASASTTAAGLKQIMDTFNVSGDQAIETLAKLAQAARGRTDVEELFTAFQRATPRIHELGLSLDDATKSIVGLLERGFTARQIGQIFNEHDAATIRGYGKDVKDTGDAMAHLTESAKAVRDEVGRVNQRIKNDFSVALEELGNKVLPLVTKSAQGWLDILNLIDGTVERIQSKTDLSTVLNLGQVDFDKLGQRPGSHYTPQNKAADIQRFGTAVNNVINDAQRGNLDLNSLSAKQIQGLEDAVGKYVFLLKQEAIAHNDGAAALAKIDAQYGDFRDRLIAVADAQKKVTAATPKKDASFDLGQKTADAAKIKSELASAKEELTAFEDSTQQVLAKGTVSAIDNAQAEIERFKQAYDKIHTDIANKIASLPATATNAERSKLSNDLAILDKDYIAGLQARYLELGRVNATEADRIRASVTEAVGLLSGDLSTVASAAMDKQITDIESLIKANQSLSDAEKARDTAIEEQLRRQNDKWVALKPAINEAEQAIKNATAAIQNASVAGPGLASTTVLNDALFRPGLANPDTGLVEGAGLLEQRQQLLLQGQQKGLTLDQIKASQEYRDVETKILEIYKEIAALTGRSLQRTKEGIDPAKEALQTSVEHGHAIQEAVNGAIRLADAFGLADQRMLHLLGSIGQLAGGLPALVDQINKLGKVDPATGKPKATDSTVLGAALPVAEGVFSLADSLNHLIGATVPTVEGMQKFAEAVIALKKNIDAFTDEANGTTSSVTATIAAIHERAQSLRDEAEATLAGKRNADARNQLLRQIAADEAKEIALALADHVQKQQEEKEDYQVRLLHAQGRDAEADALAFAESQQREYNQAVKDGADAATLAALAETQEGEAIKFKADQARKAAEDALSADVTNLGQTATVLGETPDQVLGDKAKLYGDKFGDKFKQLFDGLDLTTKGGVDAFNKRLQDLWKGVEDGSIVLDTSVFSLDDFKNGIVDLSGAATSAASSFETAAQKMADADNLLNTSDSILGTSASDKATERANLYGFDIGDISTQSGVNAAIDQLRNMFKALDPTAADFTEKSREILETIQALQAITFTTSSPAAAASSASSAGTSAGSGETEAVTATARGLTEVTGDRLADDGKTADVLLAKLVDISTSQLATLNAMLGGLLRPIITAPLQPPVLPNGFGTPLPASTQSTTNVPAGGTLNNYTIRATFTIALNRDDLFDPSAKNAADQFGADAADAFDKYLWDRVRDKQRRLGNTEVPTQR